MARSNETTTAPWQHFELLVSHLTDGITVQDLSGRVVYANVVAARMTGYDSGEALLSAPVGDYARNFEVMDEHGQPLLLADLPGRRALVSGNAQKIMRVRDRRTGSERWTDVRCFSVNDESGQRAFVVNVIRDVTHEIEQKRRLEEQAVEMNAQTEEAQALAEELELSNEELNAALREKHEDQRREAHLSRLTAVLASSLEYETTLQTIASLIVPDLSDWCSVQLADPVHGAKRLAVAHVDPAKVQWARELQERFPVDMEAPRGLPHVLRTGQAEYYPAISDEMLTASTQNAEQLQMLRDLGLRSAMIVPMQAGSRTVGAITFVYAESGRSFSDADLRFALEMGRRAGMAVERAEIHQEAVLARKQAELAFQEAQEHASWLRRLNDLTMALSRTLAPTDAIRIAAEGGREAFEARWATIWLLEPDSTLSLVGQFGYEPQSYARLASVPLDSPLPAAQVVRESEPLYLTGRAAILEMFPNMTDAVTAAGIESLASVPIRVGGKAIGGFTYAYERPRAFSGDFINVSRMFGKELGQTIDRTRAREAVEEAKKAADAANQAKSVFLATMSHELRTPINAILGYTDLLSLGVTDETNKNDYVGRIRKNTAHLLELINDILDWAKVEAGEVKIVSDLTDAASVMTESVAVVQQQAVSHELELDAQCETAATYVGDPARVRQILLNLLSNALKFTPKGGRVAVRCSASDGITSFAVSDTGIGIDAVEQEAIFDPFVQAEAGYTRAHGGTGLGLSISRKLARLMGGDVTVVSAPGMGSTFTLSLPSHKRGSQR